MIFHSTQISIMFAYLQKQWMKSDHKHSKVICFTRSKNVAPNFILMYFHLTRRGDGDRAVWARRRLHCTWGPPRFHKRIPSRSPGLHNLNVRSDSQERFQKWAERDQGRQVDLCVSPARCQRKTLRTGQNVLVGKVSTTSWNLLDNLQPVPLYFLDMACWSDMNILFVTFFMKISLPDFVKNTSVKATFNTF